MCEDLALLAAVNRAAKAGKCPPITCLGIVLLLERSIRPLADHALAELGRIKIATVTRVTASLRADGILTEEGLLAPEFRPAMRPRTAESIERQREQTRERMRRKRARDRDGVTLGDASRDGVTLGNASRDGVTGDHPRNPQQIRHIGLSTAPAPLVEEEEGSLSSSSKTRERANAPSKFIAKERWANNIAYKAQQAGLLSNEAYTRLCYDIMAMRPDQSMLNWGLSKRANEELNKLEQRLHGKPITSDASQRSMMLPIAGGKADEEEHQVIHLTTTEDGGMRLSASA